MLKNLFLTLCSVLVFIAGMITYGAFLNYSKSSLYEEMQKKGIRDLRKANLVIERSKNQLHLYEDTMKIKTYACSFGANNSKEKKMPNDNVTPLGDYEIVEIKSHPNFYKFFKLNYPTKTQAKEAFQKKIINYEDYLLLENLPDTASYPQLQSQKFVLGIHGSGRFNSFVKLIPFSYNWTNGSIALINEDIDEIERYIKIGSKVKIVF